MSGRLEYCWWAKICRSFIFKFIHNHCRSSIEFLCCLLRIHIFTVTHWCSVVYLNMFNFLNANTTRNKSFILAHKIKYSRVKVQRNINLNCFCVFMTTCIYLFLWYSVLSILYLIRVKLSIVRYGKSLFI